jgi:hypothetical protein
MDVYQGRVSGFVPRVESPVIRKRTTIVWDFRIERQTPDGKPLPRVAVEMRAKYFTGGSVNNGDIVIINGRPGRNGLVTVDQVKNLTSGSTVVAHKYNASLVIGGIVKAVFTLAALGAIAAIAAMVLSNANL